MPAKRGKNKKHALLFIDLDYFKNINDSLGHPFGDKVLSDTAAHLKKLFGDNEIVGRFGGDEFLVLLRNVTKDQAQAKAETVLKTIPLEIEHQGTLLSMTCSIGIAMYNNADKSYDE